LTLLGFVLKKHFYSVKKILRKVEREREEKKGMRGENEHEQGERSQEGHEQK